MKTPLKDLLQADWGPTMRGIAWALGHAVMVPAAVLIVFAQWLVFTWRRPLAGVLALVPVRRSRAYSELQEEILVRVAQSFGLTAHELLRPIEFADSTPNLASSSPNLADDGPPAIEISDEAVAGIRSVVLGLAGSIEPVAPLPPVLAPAPRSQRRGSKRPQSPA